MNFRKIRIDLKMTQKELANKIGVERSTISKWETEKANPNIDKLKKLSKILNCTTDELLS